MKITVNFTGEEIIAQHEPNVPQGISIKQVVKFTDPKDDEVKTAIVFQKAQIPQSGDADYGKALFDPDVIVDYTTYYYCLRDEFPGYKVAPPTSGVNTVEVDAPLGCDNARVTQYSVYDLNLISGSVYDGLFQDSVPANIPYGAYFYVYNADFKTCFTVYSATIELSKNETVDDEYEGDETDTESEKTVVDTIESAWESIKSYAKALLPSTDGLKSETSSAATGINFIMLALTWTFMIVGGYTSVMWTVNKVKSMRKS